MPFKKVWFQPFRGCASDWVGVASDYTIGQFLGCLASNNSNSNNIRNSQ